MIGRLRRNSVAWKLVTPLLLLTLLIGGAGTVCAQWYTRARLREEADRRAELLINSITNAVEYVDSAERQRIVQAMGGERGVKLIVIASGSPARVVASTRNVWNGRRVGDLPDELADSVLRGIAFHRGQVTLSDDGEILKYTQPLLLAKIDDRSRQLAGGVLTLHLDAKPIAASIQRATWVVGLAMMATAAIIAFAFYLVIYRIVIRPIQAIAQTMQMRAAGDTQAYAAAESNDEIGNVGRRLNDMVDQLERRVEEAESARQRAEDADRRLSEVARQLALPSRSLDSFETFSLDAFTLSDMMTCGAAIRGLGRDCANVDEFCQRLAGFLSRKFQDIRSQREFVDVRVYHTCRFDALDSHQQSLVHRAAGPNTVPLQPADPCLVLKGRAEDETAALDGQFESYDVAPLVAGACDSPPAILPVLQQFGLHMDGSPSFAADLKQPTERVPLVAAAELPAAAPESVRSAIGFSGELPDGQQFVVVAFAKPVVSLDVAQRFSHLSCSTLIGLLPLSQFESKTLAQIQAFDLLLANHERIVSSQEQTLHTAIHDLKRSNFELEQFAYVASHDLQEPLRKVSAFCELLNQDYSTAIDEQGRRYLGFVVDGARRMRTLIQDLLAYSRVNDMQTRLVEVSAATALHEALANLQHAIDESRAEVTADTLRPVRADPRQLTQLFQNLISNAIKYTQGNEPRVHIRQDVESEEWVFSVEDNGIGIAPAYHDRIFGIFKRLHAREKYPGTGIGLAICRRIVERMQGRIWVESEEGEGSTFRFTLPA